MDALFIWPVVAGVTVMVVWSIICSASRKIAEVLIHWRSSLLHPGPDSERVREELQGILTDLERIQQLQFALNLFLHFHRLQTEVEWRASEHFEIESIVGARLIEELEKVRAPRTMKKLRQWERDLLLEAIRKFGNLRDVASYLEVSPSKVRSRLASLGLPHQPGTLIRLQSHLRKHGTWNGTKLETK